MKLPSCVYLPKNCCGAWESQQTFNYLWKLADKNIDMQNIKASTFSTKSFKIVNGQVTWKYGSDSGGYPRFHDKGSGMNLIVRDGNSFCLVNKENVDGESYPQTLSFTPGKLNVDVRAGLGALSFTPKSDLVFNSAETEIDIERMRLDVAEKAFDLGSSSFGGVALKHRRLTSELASTFSLPTHGTLFIYDRPTLEVRA